MHFGVGRVVELHRHESVRADLVAKLRGTLDGAAHTLGTRSEDDFGAEETKEDAAFDGHRFRHREDAAVTAGGGDEGEGDAGVTGGRLDNGATRLQATVALSGVDHGATDAVLDARERVEEFKLHQDFGMKTFGDLVQSHEGRVTDGVEDAVVDSHGG